MKRIIVSDSSSNIYDFEGIDYAYTPMKITIDGKTYEDREGTRLDEMVNAMENSTSSSTACPSTGEWLEAFEGHDEVFAVTISSNLSGSYNSCCLAKNEYEAEHPEAKVSIFDSLMTGPGMRMIMEKVRELSSLNLDFDSIIEGVNEYRKKMHLCFSLGSISNLAKNGRVSGIVAKIFGVLGLRMLGRSSNEGRIEPINKVRGDKAGIKSIVNELIEKGFSGGKCYISHTLDFDLANKLKEEVLKIFPGSNILIEANTALCSFYAERHGLIIGFEGGLR